MNKPFNVIEPPCPECGNDMIFNGNSPQVDQYRLTCIDGGCEGHVYLPEEHPRVQQWLNWLKERDA